MIESTTVVHDPLSAAHELREQLASQKRPLGFLLGAGTSMAVGLPGISQLTTIVADSLKNPQSAFYTQVSSELPQGANVEQVLDRVRAYRELIGASEDRVYAGIKGRDAAKLLDVEICRSISKAVQGEPPKGMAPHHQFAGWLRVLHAMRETPVELFTTNYDLLLECAMERMRLPFFDGFVGSVRPYFMPEAVESETQAGEATMCPPRSWTRLWKLHGSVNWIADSSLNVEDRQIVRGSAAKIEAGTEIAIFPSRDKYSESRKLPFMTYQDRLLRFVSRGECHLVIVGYSFSDQHINYTIFRALRSNPRFSATALMFGDKSVSGDDCRVVSEAHLGYGREYKNLSVLGPDRASIGGVCGPWGNPRPHGDPGSSQVYWDGDELQFKLGDFVCFSQYLEASYPLPQPPLMGLLPKSSGVQSQDAANTPEVA